MICRLIIFWPLLVVPAASGAWVVHPDDVISRDFIGFGAEFSPYITAPNLSQSAGDIDDLQRKLIALSPQHVRIFVLTDWWKEADGKHKASFIRTVELAQNAGATVNITLWYGWLKTPEESARVMAQIMDELLRQRKLDCARYVTLQNEVNNTRITMEQYNAFYRLFDAELRKLNLRDRITIVAGDLLGMKRKEWIQSIAENNGDIVDGYSVHTYWTYDDAGHPFRSLGNLRQMISEMPAAQRKPVYMTEFGIRGTGWEKSPPGKLGEQWITQTTTHAEQAAMMMIAAVNHGFVATVQWEAYDVFYDKPMHCGMMGEPSEGFALRPSYHVLRMFTHAVEPGWRAVKVDEHHDAQDVLAMRGPKDQWAIFLQNRADKAVSFTLVGLPEAAHFARVAWNVDGRGELSREGEVSANDEVMMPPHAVAALISGSDRRKQLFSSSSAR